VEADVEGKNAAMRRYAMEKLEQNHIKTQDTNPNGKTWRERSHSHYQNILDLLRARGPAGVLSSELYDCPGKFGRSPRNRVSELRRDGFSIQTVHVNASTVRYVLLAGRAEQPAPRDWYEEQTGRARVHVVPAKSTTEDLPLFAGVG
jgi:hypothetical protein